MGSGHGKEALTVHNVARAFRDAYLLHKTEVVDSCVEFITELEQKKGFESIIPIVREIERMAPTMFLKLRTLTSACEWSIWATYKAAVVVTHWLRTESGWPLFPTDLIPLITAHCALLGTEWLVAYAMDDMVSNMQWVAIDMHWIESNIAIGFVVDCRDSHDKWLESTIRNVKPKGEPVIADKRLYEADYEKAKEMLGIFVNFKGWKEKWNEWLYISEAVLCNCRKPCVRKSVHRIATGVTQSKMQNEEFLIRERFAMPKIFSRMFEPNYFAVGFVLDCRHPLDGKWYESTIVDVKPKGEAVTGDKCLDKAKYDRAKKRLGIFVNCGEWNEWFYIRKYAFCDCSELCGSIRHRIAIAATQSKLQTEAKMRQVREAMTARRKNIEKSRLLY